MSLSRLLPPVIRLLAGVPLLPATELPGPGPVVAFANHSSHLDFLLLWAAWPSAWRPRFRPVAGRDYWEASALRRRLARDVFRALLIERQRVTVAANPLPLMAAALDAGDSILLFPEGTRGDGHAVAPFRAGLYHLARHRPEVPLVPLYLQNLNRILPKGHLLPVPLLASLAAGPPLFLGPDEPRDVFLNRAHAAVVALAST